MQGGVINSPFLVVAIELPRDRTDKYMLTGAQHICRVKVTAILCIPAEIVTRGAHFRIPDYFRLLRSSGEMKHLLSNAKTNYHSDEMIGQVLSSCIAERDHYI
jgi:hypothetical protein